MSTERALRRTDNQHHSTPEWYTPPWLMDRIAAFLGPGWLDPCPASYGQMGQGVNGLALAWAGERVYCNPPYGADIRPWIRKAVTEPVREIVLLVPAYTDTQWFAPLWAPGNALCFVRGRLRFVGLDGLPQRHHAPHPSVLVYRGRRPGRFAAAFAGMGPVVRTARAHEAAQPQLLAERRAVVERGAACEPMGEPMGVAI